MAKLVLDDLGNFNQTGLNTLNHNSDKIEEALENTLSRDGTYPNQMEADLDMNHNDILNADNVMADSVDATSLYLGGKQIFPQELVITGALLADNNLSDVPDKEAAKTNLMIREPFATKAQAEAYNPTVAPDFIRTEGYSAAGDDGGALYKKVATEPTTAGKLQSADGTWYEIATPDQPKQFGATGDGTTDDSANYALSEADLDSIFLPAGSVFNLDDALPTKPVFGPGSLKLGGQTVEGLQPRVFPHRSSMVFAPGVYGDSDWLFADFPTGGGQGNTVWGANALSNLPDDGASLDLVRVTAFGALTLVNPSKADRVEAFGQGALRFLGYGERLTAVGSLAMQWGGSDPTQDASGHYYNHDILYNLGTPITDPGWDYGGLETANPGIRVQIVSWMGGNPWATASTEFARNVAVGRDAGTQIIKGTNNTFLGYRAGSYALDVGFNTAVGVDAGRNNLFGEGNTTFGYQAGIGNQTGNNNTAIGREALFNFIANDRNAGLGYRAGYGCFGGNNNVYIGPYTGSQDAGDGHDQRFYVQGGSTGFMVGDMANGKLAIGDAVDFAMLDNADVLYLLDGAPISGVAPNVSARSIVIEKSNGYAGFTIKTSNTYGGQIAFADPEDNNPGLIYYNHATDVMELRAANASRLELNSDGVKLTSLPTSATGLAAGQLWNDGGTLKVAA